MLNISIPQLTSRIRSVDSISELLRTPVRVEAKYDGVKLNLVRIKNEGDIDDWIVSYKGNIFYKNEFNYQENVDDTIGNSQFRKVFDHLRSLDLESIDIPINTELFCEFIVNKDTVMSEYTQTGAIILLGTAEVEPTIKFGKIFTKEISERVTLTTNSSKMQSIANMMNFELPETLIDGLLHPTEVLLSSIVDEKLKSHIESLKYSLKSREYDPRMYLEFLLGQILTIESKFGGNEEGIVVHYKDEPYKHQQSYQLDPEYRKNKKLRYREDSPEAESAYWADVAEVAKDIVDSIEDQDIEVGLSKIGERITALNFENAHSKKSKFSVMDDIQNRAKTLYLKSLKGNNGALVIGKFRVLTVGHVRMIEKALHECDHITIGLVTSKDSKETRDMRLEAIQKAFPGVDVVDLVSANLFTAMKRIKGNINRIYTGSDRLDDYKRQSSKMIGVDVVEIDRDSDDISATKVIRNLENYHDFKLNTPKAVHYLYPKYQEMYTNV